MGIRNCKVAIIGAGGMAHQHIMAFQSIEGVQITGIFSRTQKKAEDLAALFQVSLVCSSIDELYEKTKADLVVVAVTETSIKEVTDQCFQYPWAMLLEKPVGLNLEEAQAIEREAKKNCSRAIVGLNRRFYSSSRTVLSELQNIDGPRYIQVQDHENLILAKQLGYSDKIVQSWMYANSIHLIDYFSFMARGNITAVEVLNKWNAEILSPVVACIRFSSGDMGLYEGIWNRPGPWSVSVVTSEKRFEMRPLEEVTYQEQGSRERKSMLISEEDKKFKAGFRLQAESAVLFSQNQPNDSITLSESLKTMKLINQIYDV